MEDFKLQSVDAIEGLDKKLRESLKCITDALDDEAVIQYIVGMLKNERSLGKISDELIDILEMPNERNNLLNALHSVLAPNVVTATKKDDKSMLVIDFEDMSDDDVVASPVVTIASKIKPASQQVAQMTRRSRSRSRDRNNKTKSLAKKIRTYDEASREKNVSQKIKNGSKPSIWDRLGNKPGANNNKRKRQVKNKGNSKLFSNAMKSVQSVAATSTHVKKKSKNKEPEEALVGIENVSISNNSTSSKALPISQVKCTFFPKCTKKNCPFMHPNIFCKFADKCTRIGCAYKHPVRRAIIQKKKLGINLGPEFTPCRFGDKCTKTDCPYQHGKAKQACRYGFVGIGIVNTTLYCHTNRSTSTNGTTLKKFHKSVAIPKTLQEMERTPCRFGENCSKLGCLYQHTHKNVGIMRKDLNNSEDNNTNDDVLVIETTELSSTLPMTP